MNDLIFCIGFQKTGTSSLREAFRQLGFSVGGYNQFRDLETRQGLTMQDLRDRAFEVVESKAFDAFQDTPWPLLYRELDARYPGSKFIHVTRETQSWLKSAVSDFGDHPNEIHQVIYGVPFPLGHEDVWKARYECHNAEVQEYFRDRPNDFLHMNLNKGEVGWEKICPFIGVPTEKGDWPHTNTKAQKSRLMFWNRVKARLGIPNEIS